MKTALNTKPNTRKRDEHLSSDGRWRSFPKVPNLLQYVSNGNYYGRIKIGGKVIRQSLETTVWTTAKLKPVDLDTARCLTTTTVATAASVRRCRLRIDFALPLAHTGVAQHAQALRVGGHDSILDVVNHFDEMSGPIRAATQVAFYGGAAEFLAVGRAQNTCGLRPRSLVMIESRKALNSTQDCFALEGSSSGDHFSRRFCLCGFGQQRVGRNLRHSGESRVCC